MRIIVDSREQAPFGFRGFDDVQVEVGTLSVADYSLSGFQHCIGLERKSLPDLIHSISTDRDRFAREIQRGRALECFCIICEGSWEEVALGAYRSRMGPKAATQTLYSLISRGIPIVMAGSRERAEEAAYSILRHFARHKMQDLKAAVKAMEGSRDEHA